MYPDNNNNNNNQPNPPANPASDGSNGQPSFGAPPTNPSIMGGISTDPGFTNNPTPSANPVSSFDQVPAAPATEVWPSAQQAPVQPESPLAGVFSAPEPAPVNPGPAPMPDSNTPVWSAPAPTQSDPSSSPMGMGAPMGNPAPSPLQNTPLPSDQDPYQASQSGLGGAQTSVFGSTNTDLPLSPEPAAPQPAAFTSAPPAPTDPNTAFTPSAQVDPSLGNPGLPEAMPPVEQSSSDSDTAAHPGNAPSWSSPAAADPVLPALDPSGENGSGASDSMPTDLSHLVDSAGISNPMTHTSDSVPSAESIIPSPTPQASQVVTNDKAGGFPKWLILAGATILLVVIGLSAYFILGIGRGGSTASNTSPPVANQQITVPTQVPLPTVPMATVSGSMANSSASATPAAATGSAIDLLRKRVTR